MPLPGSSQLGAAVSEYEFVGQTLGVRGWRQSNVSSEVPAEVRKAISFSAFGPTVILLASPRSADLDLELESGEPKAALPPAYIGAAYMQACIHTCRIYVRMYISAYLHTCMRTWIHIYVYIQAYVDFESRELEG